MFSYKGIKRKKNIKYRNLLNALNFTKEQYNETIFIKVSINFYGRKPKKKNAITGVKSKTSLTTSTN